MLQGAWLLKQNENTKYVKLGITGAAVLAFGFAIMYILNQSQSIAAGIRVIFNILKPFLYGALIAYILAPMCNRMDDRFLKWCPNATEKQKKGMKFLSIAIAIICAVTLVVLLILLILPQVWDSTIKIIRILPARLAYCNRMIDQVLQDQPQLQAYFNHFSSQPFKHYCFFSSFILFSISLFCFSKKRIISSFWLHRLKVVWMTFWVRIPVWCRQFRGL